MYVRKVGVPKKSEPKFTPPPEIKGEHTILTPSGKYNVIIYNWKFTHELEDEYPQLYIENRAIRNSPNYLTTASYKLRNGDFLTLTSKNIVNVIGIYNYSRVLSYCFQESNTKTRVELILSLLTEEIKTRNIYCQTKIEQVGPGYTDMTKTKKRQKKVPYAKRSLTSFGMLEQRTPNCEASTSQTTETVLEQQQQPSTTNATSHLEEANMEIVQVTDRNTEVIGKVSADGSNVDEVFSNTGFNSITLYDGTVISVPYKPEDIFHITAPEIMKFVTKEEQKKLILHQAFIDYQNCLQRDVDGLMLIHLAILNDDMELLKRQCVVLKAIGHTVDVLSSCNMTPLQMALTMEKREEFAKFLIERGADLLDKRDGRTALHIIAENPRDDPTLASCAMEYLLNNVRSILAVNRRLYREEMLKKTDEELKLHMQMNIGHSFDKQGYNPLMLATRCSNHQVMEAFLRHCPEIIDIQTPNYGKTALSLAIQEAIISQLMHKTFEKHKKVIQILISYNANPLIATTSGETVFDQLMGAQQNHKLEPLKVFISTEMSFKNPAREIGIYEVVNEKINFSTVKKVNRRDGVTISDEVKTGSHINEGKEISLECNEVMEIKVENTNQMDASNVEGVSKVGIDTLSIEENRSTSNEKRIILGESSQKLKLKPISELQEAEALNSDRNTNIVLKNSNQKLKIIPFHEIHVEKLAAEHKKKNKMLYDDMKKRETLKRTVHEMEKSLAEAETTSQIPESKKVSNNRKGDSPIINENGVKVVLQDIKVSPGDKNIKLKVQKMDKNGSISDFTIEAPAQSVVSQNSTLPMTPSGKKMTYVYYKPKILPKIVQTFSLKENPMKNSIGLKTNVSNVLAKTAATPNFSTTVNIPATVKSAATINIAATPNIAVTPKTTATPNISAPVNFPVALVAVRSAVTPIVLANRIIAPTANFAATSNHTAANNLLIPNSASLTNTGATVKTVATLKPALSNPNTNIKVTREISEEAKKNVLLTLPNKGKNTKIAFIIKSPNEFRKIENKPKNVCPKTQYKKIIVPKKIVTLKSVLVSKKIRKQEETMGMQNSDDITFVDLSTETEIDTSVDNNETKQKQQVPLCILGEMNVDDENKIDENKHTSTKELGIAMINENKIENSDEINIDENDDTNNLKLTERRDTEPGTVMVIKNKIENSDERIIDENDDTNNLKPTESEGTLETENEEKIQNVQENPEKVLENSVANDIIEDFNEEHLEDNVQEKLVTVIQILNSNLEKTQNDHSSTPEFVENVETLEANLSREKQKHENKIEKGNKDSLNTTASNSESCGFNNEGNNGCLLKEVTRKKIILRKLKPVPELIKPIKIRRFKIKKGPLTTNSVGNESLKTNLKKKYDIKQSKVVIEKLTDEEVKKLLSNPSEELHKRKRKKPNENEPTMSKVKILSNEVIKQDDENIELNDKADSEQSIITSEKDVNSSNNDANTSDNDVNRSDINLNSNDKSEKSDESNSCNENKRNKDIQMIIML